MLKQFKQYQIDMAQTAAFGRLCVETMELTVLKTIIAQPPSGGCVLKHQLPMSYVCMAVQPPSGGCVLKPKDLSCH